MDGQISQDSSSYRHGVVLGLTMAEIMLLLVFCLLIAMATVLSIEEERRAGVEETLRVEQATIRVDQDLVAAIKRNPLILESPRSTIDSNDGAKADEFWRELVDSRTTLAEFRKDAVSLQELRDRVAVVDKLKANGIDILSMLHDPNMIRSIRKVVGSGAEPPAIAPTKPDPAASGHQWPPIISLSEADGYYFNSGSAELSAQFRQALIDSTPEIVALINKYQVDVIEVVGHTDEQPLGPRQSNLDHDLLPVLRNEANVGPLVPADNAGLGLARAVSVVSVLRQAKALAGYKVIPLSGAQLVNNDETLAISGTPGDIRERRRIEIRLRKSVPRQITLTALPHPMTPPKPQVPRPKVISAPPPRSSNTPASPTPVAPRSWWPFN
jgi:outer membrane protein OmpA-like peptidoglycan-associated protein